MPRPRGLLWTFALWGALGANAAELTGSVPNAVVGLKTTYSIYSDSTTVTTVAAKSNKYDAQAADYLFPHLSKAMQNMAFVTSMIQTKGVETTETNTYWDYESKKRKSHAFVTLALQSPLTLLFEVEENYRKCKAPTTTPVVVDEYTGASSACSRQSSLTIKGPISIYGNFASSINADALLRNKQELEVTLGKSWNGADTNVVSKFTVRSVSFDEGLARFFRLFNIPIFVSHDADVGYGNGLLDRVSPLSSRQRLMLGISRVARQANERMLQ